MNEITPQNNLQQEWYTTEQIANGFECKPVTIRQAQSRNKDKLLKGIHWDNFVTSVTKKGRPSIIWYKEGVIELSKILSLTFKAREFNTKIEIEKANESINRKLLIEMTEIKNLLLKDINENKSNIEIIKNIAAILSHLLDNPIAKNTLKLLLPEKKSRKKLPTGIVSGVYIIMARVLVDGFAEIKVGKADFINGRLKQYQTHLSDDDKILYIIQCDNALEKEKELHEYLDGLSKIRKDIIKRKTDVFLVPVLQLNMFNKLGGIAVDKTIKEYLNKDEFEIQPMLVDMNEWKISNK